MRTPSIFRVLMKADDVAELPEPPKNLLRVFVPKPTDAEVLYALEPDRPYDHVVDGL